MPLKTIGDRITAEAQAEAERLRARARKTAAQVIEAAKAAGDLLVAETVDKANRDASREKKQKLAAANLGARDSVIAAKQGIIGEAFAQATSIIENFSDEKYIGILAALIATNAAGGEEVIFDGADARIADSAIKKANEALRKKGAQAVVKASEQRQIGCGFILRQGKVEESFALDLLMRSARDDLEAEIAQIIFGARA